MNNKKTGLAISTLRKKQGYTQKKLAGILNVSDKAVSKWERGAGLPDISLLSTLAMVLDSDVDSLLSGNSNIPTKEKWYGYIDTTSYKIDLSLLIANKPIISYQISYLILAGINEIYIKCSENDKRKINRIIKNKEIFIHYINKETKIDGNIMFIHHPAFIYGQNITRAFQKCMENKNGISIISLPEHISNNVEVLYDSNRRVVGDKCEAIETAYNYSATSIMFYPKKYNNKLSVDDFNKQVKRLTKEKILYTEPLFRGIIYIPLINKASVKDADAITKILEKRDYLIGDLDEIMRRRGLK